MTVTSGPTPIRSSSPWASPTHANSYMSYVRLYGSYGRVPEDTSPRTKVSGAFLTLGCRGAACAEPASASPGGSAP